MYFLKFFAQRVLAGSALVFLLAASIDAQEILLEDNFSGQPEQRWRFISDRVMGGVSTGKLTFELSDGDIVAHMTGTVSTANNGGFIQFRRNIQVPKNARGIVLRVRGNDQAYFIHARTRDARVPWHHYRTTFDATSQWRDVNLPFNSFAPSSRGLPGKLRGSFIRSLGIVAYGREHRADIEVKWLAFY